jgi:hypothetical protein
MDIPLVIPEPASAPQGSEAWRRERAGHITGSRMVDVLTGGQTAASYGLELVVERLTGEPMPEINAAPLAWGKEWEPVAREEYGMETGLLVTPAGFVKHPTIRWIGSSPDGLASDASGKGGIEVKCPYNPTNHLYTWRKQTMPAEHMAQVQTNMWVNDCLWWDFISFDPRMPPHLRLFVKRIWRDAAYIEQMREASERLLATVEVEVRQINERGMAAYHQGAAA